MDIKINAVYDNYFRKEVAQVSYSSTQFNLEFEDDVTITLGCEQFENLLKEMYKVYTNIAGDEEAEKLLNITRESEAV